MGEISSIDRAYAAGLFDGEGCAWIGRSLGSPMSQIVITNKHEGALKWLQERWGGKVTVYHAPKQQNRAAYYAWRPYAKGKMQFLCDVWEFLIIKRETVFNVMQFLCKPKDCYIERNRIHNQRGVRGG